MVLFCGGGFLELTTGRPEEGGSAEAVVLWLQVPDVDVEVARLQRCGVDVALGGDDALGPEGSVVARPRRRADRAGGGARGPSDQDSARLTSSPVTAVHAIWSTAASSARWVGRAARRPRARGHGPLGQLRPQCPLLADLPVVRYDRRGYGRSTSLGVGDLSVHADDLLDLIGDRPAVVVGHSLGGVVALVAAERRPGQIRPSARGRHRCRGPTGGRS